MVEELTKKTSENTMVELMAAVYDVVTTRQTKVLDVVVKKLKNHYLTEVIIADKAQYATISNMLDSSGKKWNDGLPMNSIDPYEFINEDEYLVLCIFKNGVGYYGAKLKTDQLTVMEYANMQIS